MWKHLVSRTSGWSTLLQFTEKKAWCPWCGEQLFTSRMTFLFHIYNKFHKFIFLFKSSYVILVLRYFTGNFILTWSKVNFSIDRVERISSVFLWLLRTHKHSGKLFDNFSPAPFSPWIQTALKTSLKKTMISSLLKLISMLCSYTIFGHSLTSYLLVTSISHKCFQR